MLYPLLNSWSAKLIPLTCNFSNGWLILLIMKCVLFCLLLLLVSDKIWLQGVLVKLGGRRVNGTTETATDGKIFNAFFGIPYARPPVGKLRFKAPIEAAPWFGTLDATKTPKICIQLPEGSQTTGGDEDCLTLNIYTPKNAREGDNIPVIFYIFGGAYKYGSSLVYGPQHFMKRDIIIVMPNYRVGVLGFLSTGDDVISGNMGLKDQSMALKWVKHNIHFFGGDSNRITIQGHSSGAACTHLHTLSPMSRGLYNRAIFQSGTGYCTGSFFDKDVMWSIAKEVAQRVGCNSSTSQEMLGCFLNLQPDVFANVLREDFSVWNSYPGTIFRPTIEDIRAEHPFLTEPPAKIEYESIDQEIMTGITSGEGIYDTRGLLSNNGEMAKELNDHYRIIMPIMLQYFWQSKSKYLDYISDSLRRYYFGNQEIGANTSEALNRLFGDGSFGFCTNDALRRYPGKKYAYLFDYVSGFTVHKNMGNSGIFGIGHADELPLLFNISEKSMYLNEYDRIFGDEMVKRWTNFAYSGDPNKPFTINSTIFGPWRPSISPYVDYLHLRINGSTKTDFFTEDYRLWKHLPLFSKYD